MKNKTIEHMDFKAESISDNEFTAYVATWNVIDKANERIRRGAFAKSLRDRSEPVRVLNQHDPRQPFGRILEIKEDERGLWVRGEFSQSTLGQDVRTMLKEGVIDRFSFGYRVIQAKNEVHEGRPVKTLLELDIMEISAVTFPCNKQAVLLAVKELADNDNAKLTPENLERLVATYNELLAAQEAETKSADPVAEAEPEQVAEEAAGEPEAPAATNDDDQFKQALADALFKQELAEALRQRRA